MKERAVVHLNIIGFRAAVAMAKDKTLRGRPFVVAGSNGGKAGSSRADSSRALALDCSPEAVREGVFPGTSLAAAERIIRGLTVLPPDPPAYSAMNQELERIAGKYAPAWENDRAGNLYLDITGTAGLFGPPADVSSRLLRAIREETGMSPAAAAACNKLVSKVATRTIRPVGFIQVQAGTEAAFFAHQDIRILPGMGPGLLRTAAVTGLREIGEIAALPEGAVLALFGKRGPLLRRMAQGIDGSRVEGPGGERRITRQADFAEDVIAETVILGAVEALAGEGGFEMRRNKLGAAQISLTVVYADGVKAEGREKGGGAKSLRLYVLDRDIAAAGARIYRKAAVRRVRVRSVGLALEGLCPLGYEADLFEPEGETRNRRLQEAVDAIKARYGAGAVCRGLVLAASAFRGGKGLLTAAQQ
jgi:DNA polymerase-4